MTFAKRWHSTSSPLISKEYFAMYLTPGLTIPGCNLIPGQESYLNMLKNCHKQKALS